MKDFAVMAKVGMGERLYFSATHTSNQNLAYSETGNLFLLRDGQKEPVRARKLLGWGVIATATAEAAVTPSPAFPGDAVTIFDAATGEVVKVIELGTNATGVGVRAQ